MYHMSRGRRAEAVRANAAAQGESPVMLQQLRLAAGDELQDIVRYLHDATSLEERYPEVAALFLSLSANEIEHYKALCRLLRVLGQPFHLQMRMQIPPTEITGEDTASVIELLTERMRSERAGEANYLRLADAASDLKTRKLMLALAAEEAGHAEALSAMAARLDRS